MVVELEQQREGIAGRGVELEAQRDLVLVPGLEGPGQPADQAVDGVVPFGLVQAAWARTPLNSKRPSARRLGQGASTWPRPEWDHSSAAKPSSTGASATV